MVNAQFIVSRNCYGHAFIVLGAAKHPAQPSAKCKDPMPKRRDSLSAAEQRKRHEDELQRRLDAGEPSPEEADDRLDEMIRKSIRDHGA
jgi:hypothetical protein